MLILFIIDSLAPGLRTNESDRGCRHPHPSPRDTTMEPAITGHEAVDHDDLLVHTWRVARLTRLGIPALLAEIHADHLDWHQIARLVQRGCPPQLTLRIVS
jgi:hypothetical protein